MTQWDLLVQEASGEVEDELLDLIDKVGLKEALTRMEGRLPMGERYRRPPLLAEAILCVIAYEKVHDTAPQLGEEADRSLLVELVSQLASFPETSFLTDHERREAHVLAEGVEAPVDANVFEVALQLLVAERPHLLADPPSEAVRDLLGVLDSAEVPLDKVVVVPEVVHDDLLRCNGGVARLLRGRPLQACRVNASVLLPVGSHMLSDPGDLA